MRDLHLGFSHNLTTFCYAANLSHIKTWLSPRTGQGAELIRSLEQTTAGQWRLPAVEEEFAYGCWIRIVPAWLWRAYLHCLCIANACSFSGDRNFIFVFFLNTFTKPNLWKIKLGIPFCVLLLDIIHAYFLFEMKREKFSTTSKVLGFNGCFDWISFRKTKLSLLEINK